MGVIVHARAASENARSRNGTATVHLILAWGFVGIPLAWGVVETLINALKLFQ